MVEALIPLLAEKVLDCVLQDGVDNIIDSNKKKKIIKLYNDIQEKIQEDLLSKNKEESYFDNLQYLIEKSTIIKILFTYSYIITNLSIEKRRKYICDYIADFLKNKNVNSTDLSIIKGKIIQQFNFCFSSLNSTDDESRIIVNSIICQIAQSNDYQKQLADSLHSDIVSIKEQLKSFIDLHLLKNIDFNYLKLLTKTSIDDLDIRFNREFNVDVNITKILNTFCYTPKIKNKIYKLISLLISQLNKIEYSNKQEIIEKLCLLQKSINEDNKFDTSFLKSEINCILDEIEHNNIDKYRDSSDKYYSSYEHTIWSQICITNNILDNYRKTLSSDTLVIVGQAGVGKSHSIAHFIYNEYYLRDKYAVFILGQHLNEKISIINMIESQLHIKCSLQQFLKDLNDLALQEKCIIPFVIEGINEGAYSEIWKNYFNGIISTFAEFKNIKLIISIRSTYIKKCLPETYFNREQTLSIEHRGLFENGLSAVNEFFNYYNISIPNFPILFQGFYNPLFLHTLCKTINNSNQEFELYEYSCFSTIFVRYIDIVEDKIAMKFRYSKGLKLVNKSINAIVKYKLDNNINYGVCIEKYYELVKSIISLYEIPLMDFTQELFNNGIFYSDIYNNDEYVQFAYERYQNILVAQYLIKEIDTLEELKKSISDGALSENLINPYSGLTEELFILIPEKFNIELLDLLDNDITSKMISPFLNSLLWRKNTSISFESTNKLFKKLITTKYYIEELIEKLLIISPIQNHPLNAFFLNEYLSKFTMANRDEFWVECLYNNTLDNKILSNLANLCISQKNNYELETKILIGITLTWSFASTNNIYRENAIHALVALIENNLLLAIELIKIFIDVNDGYVKEGLYCSIYGGVLRSINLDNADVLAKQIFSNIFNKEEVYPHIIVRSHAKGIIEFMCFKNIKLNFDVKKTIAPYSSKWYSDIPTCEEIDNKYSIDPSKEGVTPQMCCVNKIIHSMATDTGERHFMYGDFGRYIFEGLVTPWNYHFIPQQLSNIVTDEIFKTYGYNYLKHGYFDSNIRTYDRHNHNNERIGKKYQRIASFEMLAHLADNFEPGIVEREYSEKHTNEFIKIIDDISNSKSENTLNNLLQATKNSTYTEKFISYSYEGPWQFDFRGIDPTVLINPNCKENYWEDIFTVPTNNNWAKEDTSEPSLQDVIFINYNNVPYVVLETYNKWTYNNTEEYDNSIEYFIKALAVLIPNDLINSPKIERELKNIAKGTNNYECYNVFAYEYYWSSPYKYFEQQVESDIEDDKLCVATGLNYMCPRSYSEQAENILSSYCLPSKYIVEKLNLQQNEDGKWYDEKGNLVCLDIIVDGYSGALIINKEKLIELISKENLTVGWGIYTEKKYHKNYFSTRKIVKWDGDNFIINQFDAESWSSKF